MNNKNNIWQKSIDKLAIDLKDEFVKKKNQNDQINPDDFFEEEINKSKWQKEVNLPYEIALAYLKEVGYYNEVKNKIIDLAKKNFTNSLKQSFLRNISVEKNI